MAFCLAALSHAGPAAAQPVARSSGPEPVLGRFGAGAALRDLGSDDPRERLRAVERLGSLGTAEARTALVDALEPGVLRGPAREAAVRALAAHVDEDDVRAALSRELLQAGSSRREGERSPLDAPRQIAALALARSGRDRAIASLGAAVAQGGASAAAARDALLAHPPPQLEPLFGRVGPRARARVDGRTVPPALLAFLGELGDARALPILRGALGAASPATRVEAALALAKLGDEAALTLTAAAGPEETAVAVAAVEVRVRLGHPDGTPGIGKLLAAPATRAEGLRLVRLAPHPALVAALTPIAAGARGVEADEVLARVGACGGPAAVKLLEEALANPERAVAAAVALGRSPGSAASSWLEARLATPADGGERARLVALAGIVRALALGEEAPGLRARLAELARRPEVGAAELGVFGGVALGAISVDDALDARPSAIAEVPWWGAVARGALAKGREPLRALADRALVREGGGAPVAAAAALALLDERSAARWPTSELLAESIAGTPAGPLIARELARRDDGSLRAHVDQLLGGVDPLVRAHAALGLGASVEPSSASRLTALYATDDDPRVRAAVVRALSRRGEPQRLAVLRSARDLDPDPTVRALARVASSGRSLPDAAPLAGEVAVNVVTGAAVPPGSAPWTARVTRPDGLSLPVVVPLSGWLVVPGIGAGVSALSLVEPALPPATRVLARPGSSPHPERP